MPAKRPTCNAEDDDGGDEAVAKADVKQFFKMLQPFAAKNGKRFCRYPVPESMRLRDCITNSGKLLAHKELAAALDHHLEGKRFTTTLALKASEKLFDHFAEEWGLTAADKASWTKTLSMRMRCVHHAIQIAKNKKPKPPDWIANILKSDAAEVEEEEEEEKEEED